MNDDNVSVPGSYIAHIRREDHRTQSVFCHLAAVQEGCEAYAAKIGMPHVAGLSGLLHDLGKNTESFKRYIQAAAYSDNPPRRGSVDHSTAGGRLIYQRYHGPTASFVQKCTSEWIANCIISHHQGLRDYLSPDLDSPFIERAVRKTDGMNEYGQAVAAFWAEIPPQQLDEYFAKACEETEQALTIIRDHRLPMITRALLVKYVFSCLIDADRTDARQFEEDQTDPWVSNHHGFFERGYRNLMAELKRYESTPESKVPINQLRREMSQQCEMFAERPPGIYTLSIPTGGGKTLASLRYALRHALCYDKERIVYVVPYTTIIEQNASEIRRIVQQDELILEHHSNVLEDLDFEGDDYDLRRKQVSLARDNWDRPLIFTTMVQFLNTFYAKGTRNARRLHRLSNAILIFDEVQTVPPKCVELFNEALNFLNVFGKSTSLLCTATQPALDFVTHKLRLSSPNSEIIANPREIAPRFKRVKIQDMIDSALSIEDLTESLHERMDEVGEVLVILNTKSAVRRLFIQLQQESWRIEQKVKLFHLSTSMCAAHRKDVLRKVKCALKQKERVICVSTQLIEAGVDISFECVIRSLAGLDAIAQAAGRCNRHGQDPIRTVYVIRCREEVLTKLPEIRKGAEVTERILSEFRENPDYYDNDLLSAKAIGTYFRYYYTQVESELAYPISEIEGKLFDLLNQNRALYDAYQHRHGFGPEIVSRASFATAERYFNVIEDSTKGVLVPYNDEAQQLIARLNGELAPEALGDILHRAQQYVVNLYDQDLQTLSNHGSVYRMMHGHVWAVHDPAYTSEFGVDLGVGGQWQSEYA